MKMAPRKVFLYIHLLFALCAVNSNALAQTISDKDFYMALDLDYPGLEKVRSCVEEKNYAGARQQFVEYIKSRKAPKWYIDWHDKGKVKPSVNIQEANRYVNNELVSCGIWHKFGRNIDWLLNATENNYTEWTWQLNRHYWWPTLGRAYWNTGDEKYAKAFVFQLKSWLTQCVKPKDNGNYVGSPWRTLEAGLRMMSSWPYAFYYFLSSPSFDDETVFRMTKSIYEHSQHLRINVSTATRNSQEMAGLYTIGVLFPEFKDASEWRTFASTMLHQEEKDQFYPDGSQKELAPGYHNTNLSCIESVYRLSQLNKYLLPDDYTQSLERIYEFYERVVMPDGKLPAVNDSRWLDSKNILAKASTYFKDRKDFLYLSTQGMQGDKPSFTSTWMPWAGWYIMRSGWGDDSFYALFDVGPYGTAHQHEDKLSFILSAYGSRLITECGNYAYDNSLFRQYAKSARGHNVARVDGLDQNRFAVRNNEDISSVSIPLKNLFISTKKLDFGEGTYSEGYGPNSDKSVTHHRSLKFVKDKYWLVTDEFIPSDSKVHTYDIWFHFNTTQYKVDTVNNAIKSNDKSGANIVIIRLGENKEMEVTVGSDFPEVQGWVSETVNGDGFECRPVATPIFHRKGAGVVKEHFVFIPFPKGEVTEVKKVRRVSSNRYCIVMSNGSHYSVNLNAPR